MARSHEEKKAYHRAYNQQRYHKRREWMFSIIGDKCVKCGATERLEIDHIDAKSKTFDISEAWDQPLDNLKAELAKCQPLCHACHRLKSIYDRGNKPAIGTHGTLSAYRWCKCEACRAAKAAYMREYAKRRSRRSSTGSALDL